MKKEKEIQHRRHNYELILYFDRGMRGVDLIKLGYPPSSVWRYHKHWERAKDKVLELMQRTIELKAKEDSKRLQIKPPDRRKKNEFAQEIQFEEKKE